ncbi:UNVERIFIED_CONTAM: hypothetical protein PYX00_005307 [Menopon gallinae]|uniref:Uncharacterized protein n=1 Tax=Menopon gallinae TaxID=328185 RepID=A0AAW2HRQ1_9NEOP
MCDKACRYLKLLDSRIYAEKTLPLGHDVFLGQVNIILDSFPFHRYFIRKTRMIKDPGHRSSLGNEIQPLSHKSLLPRNSCLKYVVYHRMCCR